jgi:hypothetical protein
MNNSALRMGLVTLKTWRVYNTFTCINRAFSAHFIPARIRIP